MLIGDKLKSPDGSDLSAAQLYVGPDGLISTVPKRSITRAFQVFVPREMFTVLLALIATIALVFIAYIKLQATPSITIDPLVVFYTSFVTIFQLSRIALAMRYGKSSRGALAATIAADVDNVYMPSATFIIPCMNEEGAIENTVSMCFAAEYPKEKIEVIVINDGSTDGTADVLHRLQKKFTNLIVVTWTKNRGKRQAMYEGFQRANGEIVIQLDSDSYIVPETFYELIAPFSDLRIGAVCAHAEPQNADKNVLTRMQAAFYFMSFRILKAAESSTSTVFCCSGCSSAYRKSTVMPIIDGWIGEKFLGRPVTWGDDRSLTSWILKVGYKTIYSDTAIAYTIVPEKMSQLMKQQLRWKKGWIINSFFTSRFIFKAHPFVSIFYYFPLVLISILTPVMAFRAFIYGPIVNGTIPILYASGVMLISVVLAVYYRSASRQNKYWPYLFLWSLFNMFVLSYLMFYAIIRLQDRKWSTR